MPELNSAKAVHAALRQSQYLQRLQLELTLETIPRDSRYSAQLIDLMKREETAIRDNFGTSATQDLIQRVDDALRSETEKFFNKTVQQNVKRWVALQKKIEGEIQRFKDDTSGMPAESQSNGSGACPSNGAAGDGKRSVPSVDDMNRETLRLEHDYNKNWHKYEEYNLRSAFKSQIARVENDWIAQEVSLTEDYNTRKAAIVGSSALDSPSRQAAAGNSDRWQHPEKQKTLIHTAPVLSPTAVRDSVSSPDVSFLPLPIPSLSSSHFFVPHPHPQLERLERQYLAALDNLEKQKAAAIRWMSRQEIRLIAQSKETAVERKAIAEVIAQEITFSREC